MNRRPRIVVTAATVALLLATSAACGEDERSAREQPSASAPTATTVPSDMPTTAPIPPGEGKIPSGTHVIARSAWSVADFTVAFPEGWTVQMGHVFHAHQDRPSEFGFYAVQVDELYADACVGSGGATTVPGPSTRDLVTALRRQPGPVVSRPVRTTFGGLDAVRIDLEVPPGLDLEACHLWQDGIRGLQVWYSAPADKYFVLPPDAVYSAYVLDVRGRRQVFLVERPRTQSSWDAEELADVLDSVRLAG